jgi:hypothetical protein
MPIKSIDRRRNITKTVGKKIFRLIKKESVRQLHVLPAVGKKWNCSKLVQIKYKQYIASYINFKWLENLMYYLNFYFPSHHYINHLKIL